VRYCIIALDGISVTHILAQTRGEHHRGRPTSPMRFSHNAFQGEGPMPDLIDALATALARAIRTKELSSAEVVHTYLQRLEAVNPPLNAVVHRRSGGTPRIMDSRLVEGWPVLVGAFDGAPRERGVQHQTC
jgi:hypothetical protein